MSFQFRYQRILDVRNLQEDIEQSEFADVQNRLIEEREKLEDLQNELESLFDDAREVRTGKTTNVKQFNQFRDYAKRLKKQISDQRNVVEEWERKLEEKRDELIEASQKRQVMETLKEQDFEEFREEIQEQERKEQEEIANRQYFQEDQ